MKNLKLRKRGLSLIELVVALSLIAIILMIVSPFFISNYVTLDKTSNQIDFQREAKSIMNYFTESSMEASKISSIKIDNSKDSIDLTRNSTTVGLGKGDNISITFDNDESSGSSNKSYRSSNSGGFSFFDMLMLNNILNMFGNMFSFMFIRRPLIGIGTILLIALIIFAIRKRR